MADVPGVSPALLLTMTLLSLCCILITSYYYVIGIGIIVILAPHDPFTVRMSCPPKQFSWQKRPTSLVCRVLFLTTTLL